VNRHPRASQTCGEAAQDIDFHTTIGDSERMLAERWHEIERLYHSACERIPEERHAYLESATDDEALRREVESLLANEESAADFLETHTPELVARELEESIPAGTEIGPYLIVEFLRSGGMGEVYKGPRCSPGALCRHQVSAADFSCGPRCARSLPSRSPRHLGYESSPDLHDPRCRRLPGTAGRSS